MSLLTDKIFVEALKANTDFMQAIGNRLYGTAIPVPDLEAENVQLRELCKELAEFLTEAEWLQWPELRAEMQRLGVEVE